jgi:hypothetical protein
VPSPVVVTPRLIFVSGVYVPASGGSEISAHTMMSELAARGYRTLVVTGETARAGLGREVRDGVPILRIAPSELDSVLEQEAAPGSGGALLLTQLNWGDLVMQWARRHGVGCVYFARTDIATLDLSAVGPYRPSLVISNSTTISRYIETMTGRVTPIILPLVRLSDYVVPRDPTPDAITMFNPMVVKGGAVLRRIAESLPERTFLAVSGWQHHKRADGTWDPELLRSSAQGYGSSEVQLPDEVDLGGVTNITVLPAADDVRPVYARTRVLLVPSQWPEAFGRVVLEAMVNGIPVIYSAVGSLGVAADGAGRAVERYQDLDAWVEAIIELDDPAAYADWSARSTARAARYDLAGQIDRLEAVLATVET